MPGKYIVKILNGTVGTEHIKIRIEEALRKRGLKISEHNFNLVIAIGGDGTMIRAALLGKPVITIKGGRRNLLIDVPPDKIEDMFNRLLKKEYETVSYDLLEAKIGSRTILAFNEIGVVSVVPQPLDMGVVYQKRRISAEADGVLVSTAQGSTGWSFSSNGTYLDPQAGSFMISLLNPFMSPLKNIIIPKVPVKIMAGTRGHNDRAVLVADGKIIERMNHNDLVTISMSKKKAIFYQFYEHDIEGAIFNRNYRAVK